MVLAGLSLGITILNRILDGRRELKFVPQLSISLLVLLAVVLVTAQLRGGIGFRALGGDVQGGRKYIYIVAAVIAFYAVSSVRIPPEKVRFCVSAFFVGYIALAMSNFAYMLGPMFYWLFLFFPSSYALSQAEAEYMFGQVNRFNGIGVSMTAPFFMTIFFWGAAGILEWRKPWRLGTVILIVAISALGGFRSVLVLFGLVFAMMFWLEGLAKTRWLPMFFLVAAIGMVALMPVARHLPLVMQRSISFLPLKISPIAERDAAASTEWRLKMWKRLLAEAPHYFWLGKGYALSPTDISMAMESVRRGFFESYEAAIVAGNYHSGPLSVLIIFGIPGLLAFAVFLWLGWRTLARNYRHGPVELRVINRFLLACYLAKVAFYIGIFGDISSDLPFFVGLIGLGIAINGVDPGCTPSLAEKSTLEGDEQGNSERPLKD